MKNKRIQNVIVISVIVVIFVVILGFFLTTHSEKKAESIETSEIEEVTDGNSSPEEDKESSEASAETEETTEENSLSKGDKENTEASVENSASQNTEESPSLNLSENAPQIVVPGAEFSEKDNDADDSVSAEENEEVKFPYEIENKSLRIQKVYSYDGSFLEDGSNKEVSNVAAILVTNTSDVCVEYADIRLRSDERELQFTISALEAGGSCIALEVHGTQYSSETYVECTAEVASMQEMEMSENLVKVVETEEGTLYIANISKEDIPCVRIFYKFYEKEENVYVGGITYTAKITELRAGDSLTIAPSHYIGGKSRVVMVRTYDSAQ